MKRVITHVYTFVKTSHLRSAHFTVYKLHFNKVYLKILNSNIFIRKFKQGSWFNKLDLFYFSSSSSLTKMVVRMDKRCPRARRTGRGESSEDENSTDFRI